MLVVMVGILQMNLTLVFPAILGLTGFHFAIDTWKNKLSTMRPNWVIFAYLQDQVLHLISIVLITCWLNAKMVEISALSELLVIIIPALSVLLATYVWFVTERVMVYKNTEYQQWVNTQFWPRMVGRTLLLGAWFIGNQWALLVIIVGLIHHWLDLAGKFHLRGILIDVSVVLFIVIGFSVI
jgi:hypothetical protein